MKTLCLLIVLANIFVLMWEYRNGAFIDRKASQEQPATYGKEQIVLLGEQKKGPQPPLPTQNKDMHLDGLNPDDGINNEITDKPEHPQSQLP